MTPGPSLSEPTGYASAVYARAVAADGEALLLPRCGGWLVQRPVPGSDRIDASGPYPLFSCANWDALGEDLDALPGSLVSAVLVADPFGDYTTDNLRRWFPDMMRPFKDHYVVDLSRSPATFVVENHRRNARKALNAVAVSRCEPPQRWATQWTALYRLLGERHQINGPAAFSDESLAAQLSVPGLVAWRAEADGKTVGMVLWYVQGDVAYYHLAAYSDAGYQLRASFALFWHALEYFAACGLRWLNLGAGAGLQAAEDGLTRFKRGWSTGVRSAYLCGRILDRAAYESLVSVRSAGPTTYFPAYRLGEFD
ncbi:MAG: GNAT family N-acetyltransferase [Anaerolineae bacterium]|nr:GNAT family N-acetyltransferase [Anaerolineae bacterium]MCB9133299.1 GNAT family N-acetyltransferase [Anaerolineales bacterium]